MRLQAMLDAGMLAFGSAVMIAASAVVLRYLGGVDTATAFVVLGIAVTAIAVAMLAAALGRIPDLAVAHQIDRACGLEDRVRTALELEPQLDQAPPGITGELMRAAVRDGIAAAARVTPEQAAPLHWPQHTRIVAGLVVFGAALTIRPPAPTPPYHRDGRVLLDPDSPSRDEALVVEHHVLHGFDEGIDDVEPAAPPAPAREDLLRAARETAPARPPAEQLPGASQREVGAIQPLPVAAQRERSHVPTERVWGQYHDVDEETIHGEHVPAAYRAYIKRYFAELNHTP